MFAELHCICHLSDLKLRRTGVMVNAPVSGVELSAASWRFLGSSPRFVAIVFLAELTFLELYLLLSGINH